MGTFNANQLIPDVQAIPKGPVYRFCKGLLDALDLAFRRIAAMPFNRSESVSVTDTGNADTEFSVTHHLGRVPNGYLVTRINVAGAIYESGTAWSDATIYLKCSAADAAVTLRVF